VSAHTTDGTRPHHDDDNHHDDHPDEHGRHARTPSDIPRRGWKDVLTRVRAEMQDDHTTLMAAGVAFYGFLALVPALAATIAIVGLVTTSSRAEELVDDLFGALPSDAQALLSDQLSSLAGRSGGALSVTLVVSILLSLWAASSGMSNLVEAVNAAYDEDQDRGFVKKRAVALGFTLGAIAFVVVAGFLIGAVPAILRSLDLPGAARWLLTIATWLVLGLMLMAALAVLYRKGPDRDDADWRWVTWGSVVAVVLWVLGSIGFQVYVANFGSYNETYGSLAAIVVLLMWLWISALAVLVGAEVNAEIEHQTAEDTTTGEDRPIGTRGAEMADTIGEPAD
jgi:membrane protein